MPTPIKPPIIKDLKGNPVKLYDTSDNYNEINFAQALEQVVLGKVVMRIGWGPSQENNVRMIDNQLMVKYPEHNKDELYHPFIISYEDIIATDWMVVPKTMPKRDHSELELAEKPTEDKIN
jgi:hypothetical protein